MVRHGGSSAGSYFADPTSPIPSHCASVVATSILRVNILILVWVRLRQKDYAPQVLVNQGSN